MSYKPRYYHIRPVFARLTRDFSIPLLSRYVNYVSNQIGNRSVERKSVRYVYKTVPYQYGQLSDVTYDYILHKYYSNPVNLDLAGMYKPLN